MYRCYLSLRMIADPLCRLDAGHKTPDDSGALLALGFRKPRADGLELLGFNGAIDCYICARSRGLERRDYGLLWVRQQIGRSQAQTSGHAASRPGGWIAEGSPELMPRTCATRAAAPDILAWVRDHEPGVLTIERVQLTSGLTFFAEPHYQCPLMKRNGMQPGTGTLQRNPGRGGTVSSHLLVVRHSNCPAPGGPLSCIGPHTD
jgi:hypothetical protein